MKNKFLCDKCESDDIEIIHISKGTSVCKCVSDLGVDENEYIRRVDNSNWEMKSVKEHLAILCKTCQYEWREDTLDKQDKQNV